MNSVKNSARVLPTLTHVVRPRLPPAQKVIEQSVLVERVWKDLDPLLEERLSSAVEFMVKEQLNALMPALRDEIEAAVCAALVSHLSSNGGKFE